MKKTCSIVISILLLFATSCSFTAKRPEEGIWYCDALDISIDFTLCQETYLCAKLYKEDGTYQTLGCHFDYGSGISIFQEVEEEDTIDYLNGSFQWKDNEFVVTTYSDKVVYVFVKENG